MKDLGDASFVIRIDILQDQSQYTIRLSQMSYIDKIFKRFSMQDWKPADSLVAKGHEFSLSQHPKGNLEVQEMQKILCVDVQICIY